MATTWGEKRSSLRPVRMSAVACRPWPRTAASMLLVSPCVSVPGLGVLCGVGSVTTLSWPAWAQPSHSHACVVTLVGSSSHAPGQPSQPSPAQPSQPSPALPSPADYRLVGQLLLSLCCSCTAQPSPGCRNTCVVYVLYVWCHTYIRYLHVSVVAVSRVTLCGRVTRRDQ